MINVHMKYSNHSGWIIAEHIQRFSQEELKDKLEQVQNTVRIELQNRRRMISKQLNEDQKVRNEFNAEHLSNKWFPSDVDMFESLLESEHGFTVIEIISADIEIEPTILEIKNKNKKETKMETNESPQEFTKAIGVPCTNVTCKKCGEVISMPDGEITETCPNCGASLVDDNEA